MHPYVVNRSSVGRQGEGEGPGRSRHFSRAVVVHHVLSAPGDQETGSENARRQAPCVPGL